MIPPQGRAVTREALNAAVLIMSPITPHVTHLLWQKLNDENLEEATWLEVDESALEKSIVQIVVQVNGKLRGKLDISPDACEEDIEQLAKALENVAKFVDGKTLRKVIHIREKIVNFVVG